MEYGELVKQAYKWLKEKIKANNLQRSSENEKKKKTTSSEEWSKGILSCLTTNLVPHFQAAFFCYSVKNPTFQVKKARKQWCFYKLDRIFKTTSKKKKLRNDLH